MWQPLQYYKFMEPRLRPAMDLLSQIPRDFNPKNIIDLGCGLGNITNIIAKQFPLAKTIGLDNSESMLEKSRHDYPGIEFIAGNIEELSGSYDFIFSNAALHWIKKHEQLVPHLLNCLNPGGILAVQVASFKEPANNQLILQALAKFPILQEKMQESILCSQHWSINDYQSLFESFNITLNLWETCYYQQLTGQNAVFEYIKGGALSELSTILEHDEVQQVLGVFEQLINNYYKTNKKAITVFPIYRIFFVVEKPV